MDLGLAGRRALVTASSRGLGRACAEALAAEGARVFMSSRDPASLRAAAEEIGAAGLRVADMTSADEIDTLCQEAISSLGGLDVLVVNAGGPPMGDFASTGDGAWRNGHELMLMSAVRVIRNTLPHLVASEQGRILIITSISGRQPIPTLILSNSYRAAVTAMAKTLSLEVAPRGVTVNCLAPDAILSDRIRDLHAAAAGRRGVPLDQHLAEHARSLPMGRFGRPLEFGRTCAFLCSAHAGYITGQTLGVDGGSLRGIH